MRKLLVRVSLGLVAVVGAAFADDLCNIGDWGEYRVVREGSGCNSKYHVFQCGGLLGNTAYWQFSIDNRALCMTA